MARLRLILAGLLLVTTFAGFTSKLVLGSVHSWFADYGAGVLYEVFFIVLFFLLFPSRRNLLLIPLFVLAGTCLLEILQLWHPPFLEAFRATFIGATLIGTTFVWLDFPHYVIGCLIGWLLIKAVYNRSLP